MPLLDNLKFKRADPILYTGATDDSPFPLLDRTVKHDFIDFGAVGEKEVWQNVKYALLTTYYDVPLDREFGIDATFVDKPIPVAQIVLSQEVALKIGLYEPRAQFRDISFEGDGIAGKLEPTITIAIDLSTYLAPQPIAPGEMLAKKASLPIETTLVYTEEEDGSLVPWIYKGSKGEQGPIGPQGDAATVDVGKTTTGEPGTNAEVLNVGSKSEAIFDFTIPRGDVGPIGSVGPQGEPAYTFSINDFTIPNVGETVVVDVGDTTWAAIGEFVWVEGADGIEEAGSLKITDINGSQLTLENPHIPSEGAVITYVAARAWNVIGNPNFEVDQRLNGDVQVAGNFVNDRWSIQGTPELDNKWKAYNTRLPSIPSIVPGTRHRVSNRALVIEVLEPLTTLDRSNTLHIRTAVEGCQSRGIMEDGSSLSMLVMLESATPLKFGVAIHDCNLSNVITKLCEVTPGNTWTYIRLPEIPKLIDPYDFYSPGVIGYHVDICLSAGSDFISPQNDVWLPSNYYGATGQDNFLDSTRKFYITFIQHEPGPHCTPFLEKDWLTNIDECYRYYCKSSPYESKAGTKTWAGAAMAYAGLVAWPRANLRWPRPMYASPTVRIWDCVNGTLNTAYDEVSALPVAATANDVTSVSMGGLACTSGVTKGDSLMFHWDANTHY